MAVYNNGTNSGVDTFKRNRHNGKLQFVNAKRDGVGNVDHVAGIWRLAITSDDRSIYVAAFDEPSVGHLQAPPLGAQLRFARSRPRRRSSRVAH